jgi:hypothetical protein
MKMLHAIIVCLFAGLPTGCVSYIHDSKIKELKPVKAELKDFAGTFKDAAAYFTPPNVFGLEGNETLGGALRGPDYKSDVQIEITSAKDIVVKAYHDRFALAPLHYVTGKNFDFTNCCVAFRAQSHLVGYDSPAFGAYKSSMTWMLDGSGNLIVISRSYGVGFLTIIPVVDGGSTYSVFSRVK